MPKLTQSPNEYDEQYLYYASRTLKNYKSPCCKKGIVVDTNKNVFCIHCLKHFDFLQYKNYKVFKEV